MKLPGFLTGLMAMAVLSAAPFAAQATTCIAAGGLDRTVLGCGVNCLIVSGTVTDVSGRTSVTFPNGGTMPAIEYTIVGDVVKGNTVYLPSKDGAAPQTVKVKMFGGEMKDMPRPTKGEEGMHIFYGNSQVGLTSYAFCGEGHIPYETASDGKQMAVMPYGKGLVFVNQTIAAKFLSSNPEAAKFMRVGPALPIEAEKSLQTGTAVTAESSGVTPALLKSAIKSIISQGQ